MYSIPKVIHYCWFGHNQLPELAVKCIDSWKRTCPDYIIKEWNEDNFDINCCDYVREAYEAKKWAFVTDYVRLYVMVNEGGIYMDTDVEVISSLDKFLVHRAFSGFENETMIPTGIMACEKGFPLFREMLEDYNGRHFRQKNKYDMTTNVETITNLCKKHGFVGNNKKQNIEGFVIYPKDVFCPKDYMTGDIVLTNQTVTIHHFASSWYNKIEKYILRKKGLIDRYKGFKRFVLNIFITPFYLIVMIKVHGIKEAIKPYIDKIYREKKR